MSKTGNTNHNSLSSPGSTFNRRIGSDSDAFDRNDVDALGMALDDHDHDANKGLGVARLQTSATPTVAGNVQITGDTLKWWAASAAAVYTAVSLAGTQTITGNKTFSGTTTFSGSTVGIALSTATNSLGADVEFTTNSAYIDGPSCAQGTSGIWFASGTITVRDDSTVSRTFAKLWDGTTVIASGKVYNTTNGDSVISLSGYISSPAGNIRISAGQDSINTGRMCYNNSGAGKDCTLSVVRIG